MRRHEDSARHAPSDYRQAFFENLNSAYSRLKADPAARAEEEAERQEWDAALSDGLDA